MMDMILASKCTPHVPWKLMVGVDIYLFSYKENGPFFRWNSFIYFFLGGNNKNQAIQLQNRANGGVDGLNPVKGGPNG